MAQTAAANVRQEYDIDKASYFVTFDKALYLSCVQTDLCRITMSGKVSDLPIRSKRALFRQKKLDRINFKSGKRGRVLRNPPGVTETIADLA